MKTLYKVLFPVILISCIDGCAPHDVSPDKGHVGFRFQTIHEGNAGSRTQSANLPEGAQIRVDIALISGGPVQSLNLDLVKVGDGYTSAPIELMVGEYEIRKFMVMDGSSALYVTPLKGSPLSEFIKHPLPVTFGVTKNEVANMDVEVISTVTRKPEDFGYASFGLQVVEPSGLRISVFTPSADGIEFTTARALIILKKDTLLKASLDADVNNLLFKNDSATVYKLVIMKNGYGKYSRSFSLKQLKKDIGSSPLNVLLKEAFTFTTYDLSQYKNKNIQFGLYGTRHIVIDWGDGEIESIEPSEPFQNFKHSYAQYGSYFVSITGDLESIDEIYFYYGYTPTREMDLSHLTGLEHAGLGYTISPPVLDFTHNPNLTYIELSASTTHRIILSGNTELTGIDLIYCAFTTDQIDAFIQQVYDNISMNDIHNGSFYLNRDYGSPEFTGPPSEEGIQKLQTIHDVYGWSIQPPDNGRRSKMRMNARIMLM